MKIDTPWERAKKTKSQKQEEDFSKLPGASPQVNSGRHWFSKRDNKYNRQFIVENRTTKNKSYSISKEEFITLTAEAVQSPPGCLPAIQPSIDGLELWVMRLSDFIDMSEELVALRSIVDELND